MKELINELVSTHTHEKHKKIASSGTKGVLSDWAEILKITGTHKPHTFYSEKIPKWSTASYALFPEIITFTTDRTQTMWLYAHIVNKGSRICPIGVRNVLNSMIAEPPCYTPHVLTLQRET